MMHQIQFITKATVEYSTHPIKHIDFVMLN